MIRQVAVIGGDTASVAASDRFHGIEAEAHGSASAAQTLTVATGSEGVCRVLHNFQTEFFSEFGHVANAPAVMDWHHDPYLRRQTPSGIVNVEKQIFSHFTEHRPQPCHQYCLNS